MKVSTVNLLLRSYIILIALMSIVMVNGWKPSARQRQYPVCRTSECVKRGRYYFINKNLAGDPCKDFYQFACGDWSLKHPRPKFALQWSVNDVLNVQALTILRDLVDRPVKTTESEDEVQAKKLYHMCMSRNEMGKGDIQFVTYYIRSVDEYSREGSLWNVHDQFLKLTGESAFFGISYKSIYSNNTPILQFKEIASPYGSIYHVIEWKPTEERIYAEFLSKLLKVLYSMKIFSKGEEEDKDLLEKVTTFRYELNLIAQKSLDAPATDWTPTTPVQMLRWYKKITYTTERTQINWPTIAKMLYPNLSQNDMRTKPIITLRRKEYFIALALLLSRTSPHVLRTHMYLFFMERHLNYNEEMRRKLEIIFTEGAHIGRIREDAPRWMVCLEEHSMQLQLTRIYVKNFFPPIDQQYIQRIVEGIRDILKEDIRESWLDESTKRQTIRILNRLKTAIGFPPWELHPDDKISVAGTLPMKPNAFYDPDENRIYLAAATLTSPIYEPDLPLSINIAGIGSIIARELHNIFSDCGSHAIEGSSEIETWWSKKDQEICENKKQCFIQKYYLYAIQDFLGFVDHIEIDSEAIYQENIADMMGLHLAYRYHKRKSEEMPGGCQVLPGFEDFTCDQLFFIAYANTMCEDTSLEYLSSTDATTVHIPSHLRINNALKNHKHFSEIFGCRPKSPMFNREKCCFWE